MQVHLIVLAGGPSNFMSDRFNRLDLPAYFFTLAAVGYAMAIEGLPDPPAMSGELTALLSLETIWSQLPPPSIHTRTLRACAALCLWLRVPRFLLISRHFGPFVLMVFRMLEECAMATPTPQRCCARDAHCQRSFEVYVAAVRTTPSNHWHRRLHTGQRATLHGVTAVDVGCLRLCLFHAV